MDGYNTKFYRRQRDGNPIHKGGGKGAFCVAGSATLAEINAGKTLIAGVPGQQIRVIGGYMRVNGGALAALTALELQESDGTPVIVSWAVAQLADASRWELRSVITGQTIGAGFNAALAVGNGVKLVKTGSDATTATGVEYILDYVIE